MFVQEQRNIAGPGGSSERRGRSAGGLGRGAASFAGSSAEFQVRGSMVRLTAMGVSRVWDLITDCGTVEGCRL